MRKRLLFMLATGLFWLGFFELLRFIFVLYQGNMVEDLGSWEVLKAFLYGMYHDVSLAGYILLLTGLILSLSFWLPGKKLSKLFTGLTALLLLVSASILVPNLELYRNWNFHLDATVLSYLKNPKEAAASTPLSIYIGLTLLFIASIGVGLFLYRKWVVKKLKAIEPMKIAWVPVMLFVTAAMIIPVRGGVGIAPMNVGFVYYSNHMQANHIAVNPVWNFSYSMKKVGKSQKEYKFLTEEEMVSRIDGLKAGALEQQDVLKSQRPNVLVLIMESFTAKVIEQMGGEKGVTPNFRKLSEQGLLFDQFYAIGDRSKIGLVGLLSGYPGLPQRTVISYARKVQNIPSLCQQFNNLGYRSSYYYGGDLRFASMNSYVATMGFQEVVTADEFPEELNTSKWGVHDEYLFDRLLKDIQQEKDPYFKVFFTLSSHEPFDVPMETVIQGDSEDQRFKNSIYYTDRCLGEFIGKLKKEDSWDNTLVVLVADHGVRYIGRTQPYELIKYKIPMLWIGGALKEEAKGRVVSKIGCQPDMSNTILTQLGLDDHEFIFGKNLLNEAQEGYAYFGYNNGFGYVDAESESVYDLNSNDYLVKNGKVNQNWQSILQYISKDFNAR